MNKLEKLLGNCVSIDIETTGLDPNKHGIIDIGVCNFRNEDELLVKCSMLPDTEYDEVALKINGCSVFDLKQRGQDMHDGTVSPHWALHTVLGYCEKNNCHVIIGKNPRLDYQFLLHVWLTTFGREEDEPKSA